MEIVQYYRGCRGRRAPVIVQASQGAIKYAGLDMIVAMVKVLAEDLYAGSLHLDHGTDYDKTLDV